MCDYSLEHYHSRSAVVGEKLMVHQFESRSIGMIGAPAKAETMGRKLSRFLMSKLEWDNQCPVCLQPGTELVFSEPIRLRADTNTGSTHVIVETTAKFVQLERANHCDAIELPNGDQYLLQRLESGQTCTVLQLPNTKQIDEQIKTSDEQAHNFEAVGRALNHARERDCERMVQGQYVGLSRNEQAQERERMAREIARNRIHPGGSPSNSPPTAWVINPELEPLDRPVETV